MYGAALATAVATPGPAVVTVLATGTTRGTRFALLLAGGIAGGDVILATLALLGLALVAAAVGWMLAMIKYAGAAYLIWLGIRMWRSPPNVAEFAAAEPDLRAFGIGFAVAIGNPKAIFFHASLMPVILDVTTFSWRQGPLLAMIVLLVNIGILSLYALIAGRASHYVTGNSRMRWFNRIGGGAMIWTGAAIAAH